MSSRLFPLLAGLVLSVVFLALVVQPAVARGGFGELVVIGLIFVAVLLGERWLRTR